MINGVKQTSSEGRVTSEAEWMRCVKGEKCGTCEWQRKGPRWSGAARESGSPCSARRLRWPTGPETIRPYRSRTPHLRERETELQESTHTSGLLSQTHTQSRKSV